MSEYVGLEGSGHVLLETSGGLVTETSVDVEAVKIKTSDGWIDLTDSSGINDTGVWMPLTTVIGSTPDLVWDSSNNLIPTLTPI